MRSNYKYDVFISYYHEDKQKIQPIFEKMTGFGLKVFWSPKTLELGVEFPTKLGEDVISSQHFAVYWSPKTAKSKWVPKECEMFLSQCHLPDKTNRRMYVLLEPPCSPDDLPGLLRDLNRPGSDDELVTEVVKTVLNSTTQECDQTAAKQEGAISQLQKQLDQERQKVREGQGYYRHNRFWGPISKNGEVHIFTCARDVRYDPQTMRRQGGRTNIDMWDYRAVLDITHFFASNYPNAKVTIEVPMSKLHDEDLEEPVRLADYMSYMASKLENKDCIIIGSPDVSDFAELVLARIHKIKPYTEGRVKSKGFVIIKDRKYTKSSFYWNREEGEKEGVAQITGTKKYDPFPHEPASEDEGSGKMHGILIVANNPFCKGEQRKRIIILSGFSGVATNAIAKLLTDDKYVPEFFKLDDAYADINQDIEALVGVKYVVEKGFADRDTRQIMDSADAITFEKLVVI